MRPVQAQVLLSVWVAACGAHVLYGPWQGYPPPLSYELPPGPPLPPPPPPLLYRGPELWLLPPPLRGVFPPFVERIVQRIQTYWSVYNPPHLLTKPPPEPPTTPYTKPAKKATTPQTSSTTPTPAPDVTTMAVEGGDATTSASPEETTTARVATLAVVEVTPAEPRALEDHEPPGYLTAERASLLGNKEAFLKFLQNGQQLPPQPDGLNSMDDTDYE